MVEHPPEEVGQSFALGGVGRVSRDQQPGKAGDWIRVCSGGVGNGDTIVGRHRFGSSSRGSSYAARAGTEELARGIANRTEGHLVLLGINQLNVAKRVG